MAQVGFALKSPGFYLQPEYKIAINIELRCSISDNKWLKVLSYVIIEVFVRHIYLLHFNTFTLSLLSSNGDVYGFQLAKMYAKQW